MSAVDQLEGLTLANNWRVVRQIARNPNGTGGTFSQSYLVEKDGKSGFMKAFDFSRAFEPGMDTLEVLQVLTTAYNHERDVLEVCKDRRLSNVALAIDHGHIQVPKLGQVEGRVYYLIFELAEGDVRCQIDSTTAFDTSSCLKALKDVSLGLWQVHREMIAHQDTKPSNVLSYPDKFKIADFGRASRRGHPVHHDECAIPGDKSYAPPELLYGFVHSEFMPRRMGCDLYMLGNLAAFLFSGTNVTAQLLSVLDKQHHPREWNGTYADVLPYLQNAFTKVLADLSSKIDSRVRTEITVLISELCAPDLTRRGHPRGLGRHDQYSLERYVSHLDLLHRRFEVRSKLNSAETA